MNWIDLNNKINRENVNNKINEDIEENEISKKGLNRYIKGIVSTRNKGFTKGLEDTQPQGDETGDDFIEQKGGVDVISPVIDPDVLMQLLPLSETLNQNIDATVDGVYTKDYKLISRITKSERMKDETLDKLIREEKDEIDDFLTYLDIDGDPHVEFKKKHGKNIEVTGNSYWEIVRDKYKVNDDYSINLGEIYAVQLLESVSMRIASMSKQFIPYDRFIFKKNKNEWIKRKTIKRFKFFVQIDDELGNSASSNGENSVFFKEFGDPRVINSLGGEVVTREMWAEMSKKEKKNFKPATEIIHFKYYFPGSPYGAPRYIGALYAILGSIFKSECDLKWFSNGSKADLAIMSDAPLDKASIDYLKQYVAQSAKLENARKALVLIPEQQTRIPGLTKEQQAKITLQELGQRREANFIQYGEKNDRAVQSSFRISDLHIGKNQDFNRATAEVAQEVTEDNVFKPTRNLFDFIVNNIIFALKGFKYHVYESKPSTKDSIVTMTDAIFKLQQSGLTIRDGRTLIERVFNIELEDLEQIFGKEDSEWLDVPIVIIKDLIKAGAFIFPGLEEAANRQNPNSNSDQDQDDSDNEDEEDDENNDSNAAEEKIMNIINL